MMASEKCQTPFTHTHRHTHTPKCPFSSLKMVRGALKEKGKVCLSVHLLWFRAVGRWAEHS